MTHYVVDRDGTRKRAELDPLRVAVRRGLRLGPKPWVTFPWHIISVVLGRAGVVLVRRERTGPNTERHIIEWRTLNRTAQIATADGQRRTVEFFRRSRLERAAITFLAWRQWAWDQSAGRVLAWWRSRG